MTIDMNLSFDEKMKQVEDLVYNQRMAEMTLPKYGTCEVDDETALMDPVYFGALGEYSLTLPTGTYIGKRWKRNTNIRVVNGFQTTQPGVEGPRWYMGEYYDCGIKDQIGIKWRRIVIV